MKAKDITEEAADRQLFVMFPSEIDDLLNLTEKGGYACHIGKFLMYHYLFDRRTGTSHGEAIVRAKLSLNEPVNVQVAR
ncbi:MAG: hypothetical protein JWP57_3678 [Spirosoma sp.]|nr:hypothetical protein [Spirosoma sp.]